MFILELYILGGKGRKWIFKNTWTLTHTSIRFYMKLVNCGGSDMSGWAESGGGGENSVPKVGKK